LNYQISAKAEVKRKWLLMTEISEEIPGEIPEVSAATAAQGK
jgi:hypothetical protein